MIFLIEAVLACVLFTLCVTASLRKDPLNWISDYPPAIQRRARELGLVPQEKKLMTTPELVRKTVFSLLLIVLLVLVMIHVNGAETFGQGFLWSYALYAVVDWYDALVIDCLWFCHNPRAVLPGTEDMVDSYHDYGFHMKQSLIGMVLGLPICLLAGLGVSLFA